MDLLGLRRRCALASGGRFLLSNFIDAALLRSRNDLGLALLVGTRQVGWGLVGCLRHHFNAERDIDLNRVDGDLHFVLVYEGHYLQSWQGHHLLGSHHRPRRKEGG